MPVLRSAAIPEEFVHGFTTRDVFENALFPDGVRLFRARQVHGADVLEVAPDDEPRAVGDLAADALLAAAPGLAVGVVTADCVPILLCAPARGAFAAVHAGWRGTVARTVAAAVAALARRGVRPAELRAAIGPAICARCYEVGEEVAAAVAAIDPAAVSRAPGGRPHADLRRANRALLLGAGVPAGAIDDLGACTACDPRARFHSYRRDRELRGEQLAFIGRRGP